MSAPAENLFLESSMESQDRIVLAVLERDVVHLDKGLSEVKAEVKELRSEMKSGFSEVRKEISLIKDSLASAKLWALTLYIGMGIGLLALIGKAFHWI